MIERFSERRLQPLVFGLMLLLGAVCASAATPDQIKQRGFIRIAVANEQPYGYLAGKNDAEGFGPSTAKRVLAAMGIHEIHWMVVPFDQLIPAVNEGKVDMVAASQAILPRRCDRVLFSRANTSYGEGLLVAAGNPQDLHSYGDIAENTGLKLGVVAGTSEMGFARNAGIAAAQIATLDASTDAAQAVSAGRIDAYAGTQFTVANIAGGNPQVTAAEPYPKKPFPWNPFRDPVAGAAKMRSWGAFSFAKTDKALRDAFDDRLADFQQTRDWHEILTRYGLDQRSIEAIDKKTTAELCQADENEG